MGKLAAKKTAGVLGDDLSLNAQQVTGVRANRELPVVWGVAKGSLLNKVILVPLALLISAFIPWAITPLLMLGGLASYATGRAERARSLLELYVLRMPGDPAGRKLLANIYLASGDTARVADLLDPLLRSGDADPQVLTTLAALKMQQNRFREAAEALDAAARATGGNPGITAQMGFARLAGQQADLGLAALRSALQRHWQPDRLVTVVLGAQAPSTPSAPSATEQEKQP